MNLDKLNNEVLLEIENGSDFKNMHGIDKTNIIDHIQYPELKDFFNPLSNLIEKHWVVFDEDKENGKEGYLIFYSERDNEFGIGTKINLKQIKNTGTFIGIYGSFLDTVASM